MKKYKVGDVITCIVSGIEPYGIFVSVDKKYSGLIHISEISNEFVRNINDYVKLEEKIFCKIIDIDENTHQMKLSIKDIDYAHSGLEREYIDTEQGFQSLKEKLPIWMEEKLNEYKKES